MQGLREAQALLDEGVLSQEEFNTEKAELGKERDERKKAAEGGVPPPPKKAKAHKCAHGKRKDRCDAGEAGARRTLSSSIGAQVPTVRRAIAKAGEEPESWGRAGGERGERKRHEESPRTSREGAGRDTAPQGRALAETLRLVSLPDLVAV